MYNNFRSKFSRLLLQFDFGNAMKVYDQVFFEVVMKRIERIAKAYAHMKKIILSIWAMHAFYLEVWSDHITNNMYESFNQ